MKLRGPGQVRKSSGLNSLTRLTLLGALVVALPGRTSCQDDAHESRSARSAGRYGQALLSAARVGDPGQRALLELEARYWAGDLGGALRAARRGLEQAPSNLELLYYATLLPLDLAVPDLAAETLPRLELAARETAGLADDVRAGYLERCEGFAERLADQQAMANERERARSQAQLLVAAGGAFLILATLGLLVTPGSKSAFTPGSTRPRG